MAKVILTFEDIDDDAVEFVVEGIEDRPKGADFTLAELYAMKAAELINEYLDEDDDTVVAPSEHEGYQ
jgi:hypothetical protein